MLSVFEISDVELLSGCVPQEGPIWRNVPSGARKLDGALINMTSRYNVGTQN